VGFQVNGQVTTTASITWGYAFLIHNPHVQQKCQEELDRVVGLDRLVTMNDKPNLPYCTATVEVSILNN
jgi:coumaroylquinate(coumaroylshikimate) 3'-monooxygenase